MRICSVENCDRKYFSGGYCSRHHQQMYNHGRITSASKRSRRDPNKVIIENDICILDLFDNEDNKNGELIFDLKYKSEMSDKLKWHLREDGYVMSTWTEDGQPHSILAHQYVMYLSGITLEEDQIIDHKDNNKSNNLENNLRICDISKNGANSKIRSDNTSGWKGVYWHKAAKKWAAQIMVNRISIYLGLFTIKEDAARAYNVAALKYFGEFAVLNDL